MCVLSKGLSFCPTPSFSDFQFEVDIFKLERGLKLKQHFGNTSCTSAIDSSTLRFRNKSSFVPVGSFSSIETFAKTVKHQTREVIQRRNIQGKRFSSNLNKVEKIALKSLQEDKSLIIKSADKGGAIIVMDYCEYRKGILALLTDSSSYTPIPQDPILLIRHKLLPLVEHALNQRWISEGVAAWLQNEFPRTPVIYGLPKIHKGSNPLLFRPIVAGTGSLLQPLAMLLDFFLQPLVRSLPSYIRDTNDFLSRLCDKDIFNGDCILVTMDITSLYTCIPTTLGLLAIKYFLTQREIPSPPTDFILDGLQLVLENNYFKFENSFFLQTKGTAMGSSAAPSYANLFVGFLEQQYIYPHDLFSRVKLWTRYIDDVFMIWEGTHDEVHAFISYLNSLVEGIIFNPDISPTAISFLDVSITVKDGQITTTLYSKPTDRNTLLSYQSAHPERLKDSLPISQFIRVMRICSTSLECEQQLLRMYNKFITRGYPEHVLDVALDRARTLFQQPKLSKVDQAGPSFTTRYSMHSKHIKHVLQQNSSILKADSSLVPTIKRTPRITYSRNRSLRDLLVCADPYEKYENPRHVFSTKKGCYKCYGCNVCNSLNTGDSFFHPSTGKKFSILGYFNCNTDFCIYLLKCPCSLVYVGKTINQFKRRFQKHKSDIKQAIEHLRQGKDLDPTKPVAIHFATERHQVHELKAMVIEHVPKPRTGGNRNNILLRRESFWIHTLATVKPKGLNTTLSLSCFLTD